MTRCMICRFLIVLVAGLLFSTACNKSVTVSAPTAPVPAPAAPSQTPSEPQIVYFRAEPATVDRGQLSALNWQVLDATEVQILPGLGPLPGRGSNTVSPDQTTEYQLIAKGPGGETSAVVTVTVKAPAVRADATAQHVAKLEHELKDVFFDYDGFGLRDDARAALTENAELLKKIFAEISGIVIRIEGHCDERGSAEYNLALGDMRASTVRTFLVEHGVASQKLISLSFGNEVPLCTSPTEECWTKNRRVHLAPLPEERHDSVGRNPVN